jgi:transposase
MEEITTVGIDLAKTIFQVHAIDASGQVVVAKAVRRAALLALVGRFPPCLIGMEACASSHHWAREMIELGHKVRLIPPAYVKAYVRRQKNDAADAAAICEAVGRPSMRFVPVKSEDRQAALMQHRVRALLVGQRTALICALRGHMAEFGIVAPRGAGNVEPLLAILADAQDRRLPATARMALEPMARQLAQLQDEIEALDRQILDWHRSTEVSRRLATIPGVGTLGATALAASITDPSMFRSGPSSPPSWAWSRASPRAAARSGWGASPRWVIATCAPCWSSAPPPSCATPRRAARHPGPGPKPCWPESRSSWSPWRWPTSWRALSSLF